METKESTIFIPMKGVGSSFHCYSSVLSHFNIDECRGNKTIQRPKKEATKFSLYFLPSLGHFTFFLWLSLFLYVSKRTKPGHQTIRGHQNKKEQKDMSFVLAILIIFAKSGPIGFLLREGGVWG